MSNYLVFYNDYKKGKENILFDEFSYQLYEGLEIIRNLAEEYIINIIGNKPIKYYTDNDHGRDFGYFITKPLNNNNSLIVCNKYIQTGYFYNKIIIDKIICFSLVKDYPDNDKCVSLGCTQFDKQNEYLNVLTEMKKIHFECVDIENK